MFKESFKYYKTKCPEPEFTNVIDIELPNPSVRQRVSCEALTSESLPLGLRPVNTWCCYDLHDHPGLLIVRNPFTTQGQRYWCARSLQDFPRDPNIVNLSEKLFTQSVLENWWRELQQCTDENEARRMKIAMRWTTMGYHHDWNTKIYNENMRTAFPNDLAELCNYFSKVLFFKKFTAEAAIVNYYPIGTTLSGHTDHSEVNLQAPLFSLSFGQSAIFLIGGKTKEEKPSALLLRSGDVLIMSKEARLCYHAVPRIMKALSEPWNELIESDASASVPSDEKKVEENVQLKPIETDVDKVVYQQVTSETFWTPFKKYLHDCRININVRQVLNDHDTQLP